MVRKCLAGAAVVLSMASCSSVTRLTVFKNRKQEDPQKSNLMARNNEHGPNAGNGINSGFEVVSITAGSLKSATRASRVSTNLKDSRNRKIDEIETTIPVATAYEATELQKKYALMLNTLPATLTNISLLENIDQWYGAPYRYGGITKRGVDCSAFTRQLYKNVYDIDLPRTAREQFYEMSRISRTDLQEGDLVFFNTTGGISHVGLYIGNNKFVHASVSRGVTISDLQDPYYTARYIGAGRLKNASDNFNTVNNYSFIK